MMILKGENMALNKYTEVVFKRFKGDIVALFPKEQFTHSRDSIMSYMHIGQHGEASKDLLKCRNAKYEEYKPLMKELISIGYNLKVRNKND